MLPSASGTSTSTVPASCSLGAEIAPRGDRAGAAPGDRQQPPDASRPRRAARMGAHDQYGRAVADIYPQFLAPRDQIVRGGGIATQDRAQERGRGLLRGTLGRAHALNLRRDQGRDQTQHRRIRLAVTDPHPHLADGRVGDLQLERDHIVGVTHQRALVSRRARRDGEDRRRAVDQDQARIERPAGRAQHLRQARAGLHRLGDLSQRREVRAHAHESLPDLARHPASGQNHRGHWMMIHAPSSTPTPASAANM